MNPRTTWGPPLLAAVFVALTAWSWRKWPDALVDFGRELYVPWQLAAGQQLYSDIAYFNGPLSPWLNSVLFQVFGAGLTTLVLANLVVLAAVAAMVYFLVLQVGRPFTASVSTLVFLTVFAFGQYLPQGNYNFVTPYSHEMTHGTALSLAALVLLSVHVRSNGAWSLFACGLAVGLSFLTKAELFLAVAVAVPVGLVSHRWRDPESRSRVARSAVLFGAGVLVPPVIAFLALLPGLAPGAAIKGVLGSWAYLFSRELGESRLYQEILGVEDVARSLSLTGAWCLRYAALLVPAVAIGFLLRRSWRYTPLVTVLLVPLGALAVLAPSRHLGWEAVAQPFPLALIAVTVALLVLQMRPAADDRERGRRVLMLSFAVYALALLAKMLLHARIVHYGFALAMPAAIVLVVTLLEGLPYALERRGANGTAFRAAALGILAGFMAFHLYASNSWFRLRTVEVGRGSDTFLTDARGRVLNDVLDRLEELTAPGDTLAVLPEGVIVNYLSRMVNPTPYINFMPPELIMFGEENIVAAFAAAPPDWIVLTDRHAPEYGLSLLGTDYGLSITDWIRRGYELEAEVVDPGAHRIMLRYAYILRSKSPPDAHP